MRWAGHVAYMRDWRKSYRDFVGKPEGKRPLERWEDGIRMDLTDICWRVWNGFFWLRIGTGGGLS
jgi:hypothetical protein